MNVNAKPARGKKDARARCIPKGEQVVTRGGDLLPHLPHDRDESASSQQSPPREIIEQAQRDLDAGLVDAGLAPPMDELYEREFRRPEPADPTSQPPEGEPPQKMRREGKRSG